MGHTLAYSGTLAEYGNIGRGMENYMNYVNDTQGGIKDSTGKTRKMQLIQKDDGYDPARTIPLTDELLDSDKVFAITTGGSANVFRVYDKVNQRCVPQPIALTGHPAWGDPVNHPWTVGYQLSYYTEAILWGTYIEQNTDPGVTVAAIVINNDFGKAYSAGFEAFRAQSKHNIDYKFETIEPTAPNITNEMTTLAASDPDVFIAMTAGTSCTQAITEAAQNGMKGSAKILFQPSVCKSISFLGKEKVGGDGSASDGWVAMGSGAMDILDPAVAGPAPDQLREGAARQGRLRPEDLEPVRQRLHLRLPLRRVPAHRGGARRRTQPDEPDPRGARQRHGLALHAAGRDAQDEREQGRLHGRGVRPGPLRRQHADVDSRWATSSTSRARPVCAPGTSRPASASEPLHPRPLTNLHRRLATAASPR